MSEAVVHASARCCWCAQPLVQIDAIWWCPTSACNHRQRAHGLGITPKKGQGWKWLYVPTPKQVEFDACQAPYVLYGGAAGPGKSHAGRWAIYRRCLRIQNFKAIILRETYGELERTHMEDMAAEHELIGSDWTPSKFRMRFPTTGSVIEVGHMEDAHAVKRYLSAEYDAILADEGSQYPPNALLELSTRARTTKPAVRAEGGAKFWVVSNPGGPSAGMLLDFFIDHEPDYDKYPALRTAYNPADWVYIPGRLDDNPYMDPNYEQRQLAVLQKWRYEQLRNGDWRVFSGQFFSEWQDRTHVAALEPPSDGRWFRSLDWGRNQPGCVLWWTALADHKLYIRREWKFQGMSEMEVAQGIKAIDTELGLRTIAYTAADPSIVNKTGATHTVGQFVGQAIGETLGYYKVPVIKADNDRFNGWMRCHALLRTAPDGSPWLQVHPDCRYLIRSIAAAVSDKTDPDDVDTTSDDHALDAWRYGAMSRPHPAQPHRAQRTFAPGTMGHLRQSVTAVGRRLLGAESAHA